MTSILTNTSAMTVLQNLSATQKSLADTQKQISSGLAVADASDNAGVWALANNMKADIAALGSVSSAISIGSSIVSTASSTVGSIVTALTSIKATLASISAGQSASSLQGSIAAQQQAIANLIGSSSFSGINLLDNSQSSVSVVDAYYRTSATTSATGSLTLSASGFALGGTSTTAPSGTSAGTGTILGATLGLSTGSTGSAGYSDTTISGSTTTYNGTFASDSLLGFKLTSTTSAADVTKLNTAIDTAITNVTNVGTQLGAYTNVLSNQSTAISSLSDSMNTGLGSLVDADMNVASARLQALQTQQQLGIQMLSVANENSSSILKLFGV